MASPVSEAVEPVAEKFMADEFIDRSPDLSEILSLEVNFEQDDPVREVEKLFSHPYFGKVVHFITLDLTAPRYDVNEIADWIRTFRRLYQERRRELQAQALHDRLPPPPLAPSVVVFVGHMDFDRRELLHKAGAVPWESQIHFAESLRRMLDTYQCARKEQPNVVPARRPDADPSVYDRDPPRVTPDELRELFQAVNRRDDE